MDGDEPARGGDDLFKGVHVLVGTPEWWAAMGVPAHVPKTRPARTMTLLLESAVPAEQRSLLARVRHGKRKYPVWALTASGLEALATTARGASASSINSELRLQEALATRTKMQSKKEEAAAAALGYEGEVPAATAAAEDTDEDEEEVEDDEAA